MIKDFIVLGDTIRNKNTKVRGSVYAMHPEKSLYYVITFPQDIQHLRSLKFQQWDVKDVVLVKAENKPKSPFILKEEKLLTREVSMSGWKTWTAGLGSIGYGVVGFIMDMHTPDNMMEMILGGMAVLGIGHKVEKSRR